MENDFFFQPYVGEKYGEPHGFFGGIKVMALGNSHHCGDYPSTSPYKIRCNENCPHYGRHSYNHKSCVNFTEQVVAAYIQYKEENTGKENWMLNFTKFARILNAVGNEQEANLWKSIVFYNFLQAAVANDHLQGRKFEKEKSKNSFIKCIEDTLPDVIIVWGGTNVYQFLPKDQTLWSVSAINPLYGTYRIKNKDIKVICIDHPQVANQEQSIELIKAYAPELFPSNQ